VPSSHTSCSQPSEAQKFNILFELDGESQSQEFKKRENSGQRLEVKSKVLASQKKYVKPRASGFLPAGFYTISDPTRQSAPSHIQEVF
jgi:hypothetical protein